MRFYTTPHRYYCGIDLHARRMYICRRGLDGSVGVASRTADRGPRRAPQDGPAYETDRLIEGLPFSIRGLTG